MAKLKVKASFKDKNNNIETGLSVISFIEDGVVIIYSPALDLSGYGNDFNEAKASFWETLQEFFRYTTNKNTLIKELTRLGWNIKGTKGNRKITAPAFSELLKSNKEFEDIVENREFKKFTEKFQIPELV